MPNIVTRPQWGAEPPRDGGWQPWPVGQPTGTTEHWEGAGGHADHSLCATEVKSIQLFHFGRGYVDIAYNWLICLHGWLYEGRPVHQARSAAQNQGNPLRVAICFMWGPKWSLTPAAKFTFNQAVAMVPAASHVICHQDEPSCSTGCGGPENNAWVRSGHPGTSFPPMPAPIPPVTHTPAGYHHPVLALGATGPAVLELQRMLNVLAAQGLKLDGQYGPATQHAVKNWQTVLHLSVDGICGQKTWDTLDWIWASRGYH